MTRRPPRPAALMTAVPARVASASASAVAALATLAILAALMGTVALVGPAWGATAPRATATPAQDDDSNGGGGQAPSTPLSVTVDSVTPSTLTPSTAPAAPPTAPPTAGPRGAGAGAQNAARSTNSPDVVVAGEVRNVSKERWFNLNVYLLTSPEPIRTPEELTAATRTDPATPFGTRLTDPGLFDSVGDLRPGQSTSFSLTVPRDALRVSGEPGVYQLGVHVLGRNRVGRDQVADGRARTFLPLVSQAPRPTDVSVVLPLRVPVVRTPSGRLDRPQRWATSLEPEGRLSRLVSFGRSASDRPVSWLVDPAVLDAARSVGLGNPERSIAPTRPPGAQDSPEDSGSPSPDDTGSAPQPTEGSGAPTSSASTPAPTVSDAPRLPDDGPDTPAARAARTWLREFAKLTGKQSALALPYADTDVAAVLGAGRDGLYAAARQGSTEALDSYGITAGAAVAPPSGFLPTAALAGMSADTRVLLTDRVAPDAQASVLDVRARKRRAPPVTLVDSSASSTAQRTTSTSPALQLRQRILAESALRTVPGSGQRPADPLVVVVPPQWDPGPDWRLADFFSGLDVPWLRLRGLPEHVSAGTAPVDTLAYPRRQRRRELAGHDLAVSSRLIRRGSVLGSLLARNDQVGTLLTHSALEAASVFARDHARAYAGRARATTRQVSDLLGKISIEGPSFVTMSSDSGAFQVSLINDLDEPVTVGLTAHTDTPDLEITADGPVDIPGESRATVRLQAHATGIGVHRVRLVPTTTDDRPLGTSTRFSVRSSEVSRVIWLIMGLGAVVLLVAVGVRVLRRVRRRKRTHGPLLDPSRSADG